MINCIANRHKLYSSLSKYIVPWRTWHMLSFSIPIMYLQSHYHVVFYADVFEWVHIFAVIQDTFQTSFKHLTFQTLSEKFKIKIYRNDRLASKFHRTIISNSTSYEVAPPIQISAYINIGNSFENNKYISLLVR